MGTRLRSHHGRILAGGFLLLPLTPALVHAQDDVLAPAPESTPAPDNPSAPSSEETADSLRNAERAYDEMNYEKALSILSDVEKKTDLKTWEVITVFKLKAFIHINNENDIFARDAILSIYNLDPKFKLPENLPPKILKVFAEVKKDFKPKKKKKPKTFGAAPATAPSPAPPAEVSKPATPVSDANLFVRFWPSWACLVAGVGLFVPGAIVGAGATADREKFEDAPRDAAGRIIGITRAQAEKMQEDANTKALTGNLLIGAGAAAATAGVVLLFFYDDGFHPWAVPVLSTADGRGFVAGFGGEF
ncbi:MAG: hypothetical protein HY897_17850 [Deltaproteobacteria bacterium]|nr:hypothetical protein [Deltaproteobacteria bacterium]